MQVCVPAQALRRMRPRTWHQDLSLLSPECSRFSSSAARPPTSSQGPRPAALCARWSRIRAAILARPEVLGPAAAHAGHGAPPPRCQRGHCTRWRHRGGGGRCRRGTQTGLPLAGERFPRHFRILGVHDTVCSCQAQLIVIRFPSGEDDRRPGRWAVGRPAAQAETFGVHRGHKQYCQD